MIHIRWYPPRIYMYIYIHIYMYMYIHSRLSLSLPPSLHIHISQFDTVIVLVVINHTLIVMSKTCVFSCNAMLTYLDHHQYPKCMFIHEKKCLEDCEHRGVLYSPRTYSGSSSWWWTCPVQEGMSALFTTCNTTLLIFIAINNSSDDSWIPDTYYHMKSPFLILQWSS